MFWQAPPWPKNQSNTNHHQKISLFLKSHTRLNHSRTPMRRRIRERRNNMARPSNMERRISLGPPNNAGRPAAMQLGTKAPQEKVTKLRRTSNLAPLPTRMSRVKPQVGRRPLPGSGLSSEEKE